VPTGGQACIEARLSHDEGRTHWLALHRGVTERRLAAPGLGRALLKLCGLGLLLAAALATAWLADAWTARALAWLALALLLAQFAFLGHDAGHGSLHGRTRVNRALGQLAMTLVTGLAFDEWIARHRKHHQFCQDESRDPDMDVAVVVSLTAGSRQRKGALGRLMTRFQGAHVWLLALLFGHSQRHLSQAAVFAAPRQFALDAAFLLLHFGLWFGLPCGLLGRPIDVALLAYGVPLTLLGPYLAAIFWVNHVGMPLVRDVQGFSFFEHQVVTSRSILNAPRWNWVFGGLNFQIEHHLFPQVPSWRLPHVHALVREYFARTGLHYHGVRWQDAVGAIAAHLRQVARPA